MSLFFPSDIFVVRVTASDGDAPSTGNGVLDINVGNGGRGKFYVNKTVQQNDEFVADIYTTSGATFNFDQQDKYDIEVRKFPFPRKIIGHNYSNEKSNVIKIQKKKS